MDLLFWFDWNVIVSEHGFGTANKKSSAFNTSSVPLISILSDVFVQSPRREVIV